MGVVNEFSKNIKNYINKDETRDYQNILNSINNIGNIIFDELEQKNRIIRKNEKYKEYKVIIQLNKLGFYSISKENKKDTKLLKIIKIKQNEIKKLDNNIKKLKNIESKFIMKIEDYFLSDFDDNHYACLLMNNCPLDNLDYIFKESKDEFKIIQIYRIFIQIIIGLYYLKSNKINLNNINLSNIYINDKKYIYIDGAGMLLSHNKDSDSSNNDQDINFKKILGTKKKEMFYIGCIFYELLFSKKVNEENIKQIVKEKNYKKITKYEHINQILEKLLCPQKERYLFSEFFSSDTYFDILKKILLYEIQEGNLNCK